MLKIGDRIRDVEDGDCYYEGIVVSLNPLVYKVEGVIWNGEKDNSMIGEIVGTKWWFLKLFENNEWINVS